ncbi:MAG: hypothetical protein C4570_04925 [Ammonifex sp.]|nr:MAG: hypothetical protein C4570_04925 [Ammonifex sp.]
MLKSSSNVLTNNTVSNIVIGIYLEYGFRTIMP